MISKRDSSDFEYI
jgi:hypothetical protein